VCPVFNHGDKDHFENFQPVSILLSSSKAFEKTGLSNYSKSNNILFIPFQNAFQNSIQFQNAIFQNIASKMIFKCMVIAEMWNKVSSILNKNEFFICGFIVL